MAWVYSLLVVAAGVGRRILAEWQYPGLLAERHHIENIQEAKVLDKVLAPLMVFCVGLPIVVVAGLDHRFG